MYTVSRTAACAAFVKSFQIVLFIATVLNAGQGWGQSAGFNNTFIILSLNGGANTYYDLNAATANADFNNANLGTFAAGSTNLRLRGAEHNVFKCGGADLTSTRLYYRIYPTASPSGSFTSQTIGFTSGFNNGCGGQDQVWSNTGLTINLLTGLGTGNYTIEVYSDATITCCGGTAFASNSGNNYKATFTVSSIVWANTGGATAWYTAGNWNPSTASNAWLTGSVAEFRNSGTATTAGINMGTASLSIGQVDVTSARTRALTIGNSSPTTGTLTLNGASAGTNANVILRNSSGFLLTLQNNETGSGKTMNIALGNATTNTIDAAGAGGITISSVISGASRSITKIGTGTLTLSGTNTYSGGTIISGGTVSAGAAANLGDAAGAITLGSGSTSATLTATGTFTRNAMNVTTSSTAGVINVATSQTLTIGALNTASGTDNTTKIGKSGAGTLTLSGAGSYVGQTQIGQGTVIVSNDSGLGTNTTTTARGIDLGLNVGDVSQANNVSVLATTGITVPQSIYVAPNTSSATRTIGTSGANASATFSNEVYLDGTATLAPVSGGTLTMSGNIINTGGLITTTGTTLLSGTNTFSGTTTVSSGTLRLGSTSALGSTAGATSITSGAVLDLNGINYSSAEALTVNGTGISNGGAIINSSATGATYAGVLTLGSASSIIGGSGTISISNPGTITGSGFGLTLGGAQGGTLTSIIGTGAGTLTKQDAGTWTLSGANTYTGLTTISAGTLRLGNASALGTTAAGTSITSGAVLDLNGTNYSNAEALTVNGTGISNGGAIINSSATGATYAGLLTLGTASSIVGETGSITLSNTGTISGAFGLTLGGTQGGSISSIIGTGAGTLTKQGAGTWTLSGANTYTGLTTISAGTLRLGNASALGTTAAGTSITSGAVLDLNGTNYSNAEALTVNGTGISNGGAIINSSATGATYAGLLTLGTASSIVGETGSITLSNSGTISGAFGLTLDGTQGGSISSIIGTGAGTLTKQGAGTWTLSGANSYTGTTTISGGILRLGAAGVIANGSAISLGGGTLSSGATTGFSETMGTLALTANSTIALGTGNHTLTFANSSAVSWTAATTLTITGWTGTAGASGTAGKIFVDNTTGTLTAGQLAQINFSGFNPGALLLANGELVPRPCTAGAASSTPTLCINTALTNITHTTTGATGISNAGVSGANGLPTGVSASWASNTITISGTPTAPGTFTYSIPLTGGCGSVNATGTIIVTPTVTINAFSPATSTRCQGAGTVTTTTTASNSTGITYSIDGTSSTGGVTINASTGAVTYPAGWSGTTIITASAAGCNGPVTTTHSVTTTPTNTAGTASSAPTLCINTPLTNITHTTTGATGISNAGVSGANGLPTGVSASWASNTITISGTPTAPGTFTYSIPLTGGCGSVNATGTIIVTDAPNAPSGTGASRCGTGTVVLNATPPVGSVIDWYAAATGGSPLAGGTGSSSFTTPSISSTTTYYAASRNTTTGCSSTRTAVVASINPLPTGVVASVSPTAVCAGQPVALSSSATSNSASPFTMLSENFNAANPAWTAINNSTGGTPANAAWTIRPNNFNNGNSGAETIVTSDGTSFMFSDSDEQGSGSSTNTSLVSPAFSTVGVAAANINLNHYFRYVANSSDQAFVEASVDGTTWTTLQSYTSTQGTRNNFANPVITLTAAFLNQPTVYIRFRYVANWGWYWAINNVTVTASSTAAAFNWTSSPAGYTSNLEDPTGVTPSVNTTYTVTATNNYGCSASATTASVTVTASPAAPTSAGNSRCGAGTVSLTASVAAGETVDWYAAAAGGAPLAGGTGTTTFTTPSISTTTTYYAAARNTSTGCLSATRTAVVATINATPVISNMSANACNGVPFLANPVNGTNGTVPVGTNYTWTAPTGSGFTGAGAQPVGQNNVSQTLTLSGAGPATATYTITPKKENCTGSSYTLTLTLNASPSVAISANYCVGGGNVQLTATAGLTYLWSNGATSQTINVQQAGVYSVTATSASTGCSATATQGVAQELVANGDFENQNTGFSTGYLFVANGAGNNELIPEATYGVAKNANTMHPAFYGVDHTSGNGYFMIINGAPSLTTIWNQNNIAVLPNTTYYFSAWGLSVVNGNNAALQFSINGTQVGSIAYLPNGWTSTTGPFAWTRFYGQWESGSNTSVNLSIVNLQTALGGNDFGLDDISFGTLSPVSLTVTPAANGNSSVCEGAPFFLNANPLGGASPYTYLWSGPNGFSSSQENPTVTNNATSAINGTYSVQITDGLGCVGTNTVTVSVSSLPNDLAVSAVSASVCVGGSTQVQIASTETNVGYTLFNSANNQPLGLTTPGTGGALNLSTGVLNATTNFYVLAERYATGCERNLSQTVTVSVTTTPVVVTNNIAICTGTANLTAADVTAGSTGGGTLSYWTNPTATTAVPNPASVGSGTYYIRSVVGACSDIEPVSVIVSGTPVSTFNYTGSPFCSNAVDPSPVYSGGGTAGVYSSTAGLVFLSASTGVVDLSASTPGTYTITNSINPTGGCTPSSTSRTITITGAPDPTFAYATNNFCQTVGGNNPTPIFQNGAQAGTFSTSAATGLTFVSTATGEVNLGSSTPGSYAIINTIAAGGGCPSTADTLFVEINPYSFDGAISLSSSVDALCAGESVNFSSFGTSYLTVLERETFNGTFSAWTTTNSSSGGTPANAAWTLRPNFYNFSYISNDASQFYLSNSQAQGSGGTTSTVLQSPALNTVGFTTLSLDFYQFFDARNSGDDCKVQVSTNNSTWTTLATYTTDQGGFTNFVNAVVNMNSYVNQPTVWVRFLYTASNDRYWAIDNVTLSGNSTRYFYNWSSTPAGFTSTEQSPQNYVPTVSAYYGVQVANNFGCVVTTTPIPVVVNPRPADNAGADQLVCYNTPVTLGNSGVAGRTYSWSPATGLSGTTVAQPTVTPASSASYTLTETITATGCSDTNTVFVNVRPYSQITAMTATACSGSAFTVAPTNGTNGTVIAGTTYIWAAPAGVGFTGGSAQSTEQSNVSQTLTASQTTTQTASYQVTPRLSNCDGPIFAVDVNVVPQPNAGSISGAQSICTGANAPALSVAGGVGSLQWQSSTNNITFDNITGATNSTYSPGVVSQTTYYRVRATNAPCAAATGGEVAINTIPRPTSQTIGSSSICPGATALITLNFTGTGPWSGTLSDGQEFNSGANQISLSVTPASTATYTVTNLADANCNDAGGLNGSATITVSAAPTASISGGGEICSGSSTNITVSGSPNATVNYTLNGSAQQVTLSGAGNATVNTGNLLQGAVYTLTGVNDGNCSAVASGTATVTLGETPDATMVLSDTNAVCIGTTLNVLFSGTPNATVTYKVNGGADQTVVLNGAGTASLSTGAINANTTYFLVSAGNGSCTRTIGLTRNIAVTQNTYYADSDGDGFGVTANSVVACTLPAGYAALGGDCCDSNPNLNPLTEWWADIDGDSYGSISYNLGCVNGTVTCSSTSWPNQPQLLPYYPPANGGNSYVTDCNDNNSNVRPNALEICGNTIDDDCDGLIDEGCSTMPNDNFNFATSISLNNSSMWYPQCNTINGTLVATAPSPQGNSAYVLPGGGRDVWYKFIAPSSAVRIQVIPNGFDALIELKNGTGTTELNAENVNPAVGGTEILNYSGLVPGELYTFGVRSVSQLEGTYALCISSLMPSGCASTQPLNGWNLCDLIKANFTGANSYVFNFTGVGGTLTAPFSNSSVTVSGTTRVALSTTQLGLIYGGVYDVRIDAVYNLTNGLGVAEAPITVLGSVSGSCDNLTISSQPTQVVLSTQVCPATLIRNSYLYSASPAGGARVCTALNFTFEFTKVTDCTGLTSLSQPILATGLGNPPQIYLGSVFATNAIANGYWRVRIRPNFQSGPGQFGDASVIFINSTSGMNTDSGDDMLRISGEEYGMSVVPNPSLAWEDFELRFSESLSLGASINIYDATGRWVSSNYYPANGSNRILMDNMKHLGAGMYMLEICVDGKVIIAERIVRN